MKTFLTYLSIIALIVGSYSVYAQKLTETEKIDKEMELKEFNEIVINGHFNVFLYQDECEYSAISVEATKSTMDKVITRVKDNVLNVYLADGASKKGSAVDVYITACDLRSIRTYGQVLIETVSNIELHEIDIQLSDKSSFYLYVDSPELNCRISGCGFTEIAGEITSLNLQVTDNAKVDLELKTIALTCDLYDFTNLYVTMASRIKNSQIIDDRTDKSKGKDSFMRNSNVCFYVIRN